MPCHSDPAPYPAHEVNSPVEAGEVADEVRRKGGAPAEGAQGILELSNNVQSKTPQI